MAKLQRLATKEDGIVVIHNPVSEEELIDRKEQYQQELTPAQRLGITDKAFDLKDIIYFLKGK